MLKQQKTNYDAIVIGGGAIGLSVSYYLTQRKKKVLLVEKNNKVGQENSTHNSAVVHAGIYYKKDSLKSSLSLEGRKLLKKFCCTNKIKYNEVGKLFISDKEGKKNLNKILTLGNQNNINNLRIIDKKKIKFHEPNIVADYALYSPSSAIFDVKKFIKVLRKKSKAQKLKIKTGLIFLSKDQNKDIYNFRNKELKTICKFKTKYIINCAGIGALNIAYKLNKKKIFPKLNLVAGAYLYYPKRIFKHIVYQVFKPGKIIERTDATPDVNGNIIFGPSVEKNNKINWKKLKDRFYNSIKIYYPKIKKYKLKKFKYGIRTKIYYKDKFEVNDFYIKKDNNAINLLGIESPGLTSCLAIGKYVSKFIN